MVQEQDIVREAHAALGQHPPPPLPWAIADIADSSAGHPGGCGAGCPARVLLLRGRNVPSPTQTSGQGAGAQDGGFLHGYRSAACAPCARAAPVYMGPEGYIKLHGHPRPTGAETEPLSASHSDQVYWLLFQPTCCCARPKGSDPSWLAVAPGPTAGLRRCLTESTRRTGPMRKASWYQGQQRV